jgi:hypothetical protein
VQHAGLTELGHSPLTVLEYVRIGRTEALLFSWTYAYRSISRPISGVYPEHPTLTSDSLIADLELRLRAYNRAVAKQAESLAVEFETLPFIGVLAATA